jgi:hypothetical protein
MDGPRGNRRGREKTNRKTHSASRADKTKTGDRATFLPHSVPAFNPVFPGFVGAKNAP